MWLMSVSTCQMKSIMLEGMKRIFHLPHINNLKVKLHQEDAANFGFLKRKKKLQMMDYGAHLLLCYSAENFGLGVGLQNSE